MDYEEEKLHKMEMWKRELNIKNGNERILQKRRYFTYLWPTDEDGNEKGYCIDLGRFNRDA
jgi:hypothetical protein